MINNGSGRRKLIMKLLPDLIVPVAIYFGLRFFGLSPTAGLLAAGVYSAGRVGWVAISQRKLNVIGALVGIGVLVGAVLTMITGDPHFLMARESIVSGLLGLILVGSWLIRRPVLFGVLKMLNASEPDKLERLDQLMGADPGFRRGLMMITLVWGVGALVDAGIRIVLVWLLPLDVMAAVSPILHVVNFGLLLAWTLWYRQRRTAAVSARLLDGPRDSDTADRSFSR